MPDFPADFVYNAQPLDALYWRYSIRCHVDAEQDKVYYWPRLGALYDLIAPIMAGWQDVRLNSDQALQRMLRRDDEDGSFHATLRNAPVGGLQRLTHERLEKIGSKYLNDNDHLIARFENGGRDHARFYEPKGCARVHFFLHEIFGLRRRLKYDRSMVFQSLPHDLWLRIGGYDHQHAMSRADPINQALDLYIWQGILPEDAADALAHRLGRLTSAKHIWKTESGQRGALYDDADGNARVRYSVMDGIEDAVDGRNRYGARWTDLLEAQ
jgi:hypothetical protein